MHIIQISACVIIVFYHTLQKVKFNSGKSQSSRKLQSESKTQLFTLFPTLIDSVEIGF